MHVLSMTCSLHPEYAPLPYPETHVCGPGCLQFDEDLIASLANEDLVDSLLKELQEDFPQLLKPLLHDRCGFWREMTPGLDAELS